MTLGRLVVLALACALVACGSRTAPTVGGSTDAGARDAGPATITRDASAGRDSGAPLDAGPRSDAGGARCAAPDHGGAPLFEIRGVGALEGGPCRFRRDQCRDRASLLVCVDDRRDPTGADTRCARCRDDDECGFEYRSYGLRGLSARCGADGLCALPPPPSGMGECDSTSECFTSTGGFACVDHRCVLCCDNAECSSGRMGICETAGTCVFPIPPG